MKLRSRGLLRDYEPSDGTFSSINIRVFRWIEGWRLVPSEAEFDDVGSAAAV